MAERICFLGRGGSGKSTIAQNLAHALSNKGYHVLLVGNDMDLSTSVLLRGDMDIEPALEAYREHYEITLDDYIIKTSSGVWCLELGSLEPGLGCLARGISIMDEMLNAQGVSNRLQLDFILYDISGETPCTGYILPMREGLMQRCIIVTNGCFAAVCAANSLLQAAVNAGQNSKKPFPIQLFVNNVGCAQTREELIAFAKATNVSTLAYFDYDELVDFSTLSGKTVFTTMPNSHAAERFTHIADCLLAPCEEAPPTPFTRKELLKRLSEWQKRELARRLDFREN